MIYVSGQLPMTLDTREPFTGDIGEQTEIVRGFLARCAREFRHAEAAR